MNKKYIILTSAALLSLPLAAKTISPDEALERVSRDAKASHIMARSCHDGKGNRVAGVPSLTLAHTALTPAGDAAVYVFNRGVDGGYMLVSADDLARPMLGYADNGTFAADNMPPAFEWWLSEYARSIESANASSAPAGSKSPIAMVSVDLGGPIEPMIKTNWDQIAPFNNQAPLYGTERTYTGCVATAMAQVLNYWQYPERGKGSISYTSETIQKKLTLDFSRKAIDWNNMLLRYVDGQYTDAQADAVAYLMRACGYAVRSDYSTDATGALAMNIRRGLVKYFNYDSNARYELRAYFTTPEWEKMMYDNLKNVGPVLYGGGSYLGGGHSFICDGYDGEGYFHFNWGWSGISNGYFSLEALNPDSLGSGGGTGGGYNFTQDAVFGIQPPTGEPTIAQPVVLTQIGTLVGKTGGRTLTFDLTGATDAMWVNYNPETIYALFGATIEPVSEGATAKQTLPISDKNIMIEAGYGTGPSNFNPSLNLDDANLADGTYKVSIAVRDYRDDDAEWLAVRPFKGESEYFFLKKSGSRYTTQNQSSPNLTVLEGNITTALYFGSICKVSVTVRNDNDIELAKGFAPVLLSESNGQAVPYFLGQSVFVSVPPHSEATKEWITDFTAMQQYIANEKMDLYLTFLDESSMNFYNDQIFKPITMLPYPSKVNVFASDLAITDATVVTENIAGQDVSVTLIDDKYNIPVSCRMRKSGKVPFAYTVAACVLQPDYTADGNQQLEILATGTSPMFIEKATAWEPFSTTIAFAQAKPDTYYSILLAFLRNGSFNQINVSPIVFRLNSTSGIDSVITDGNEEADAPFYNLQGICLGNDWDKLPAGIYIKAGKKIVKTN